MGNRAVIAFGKTKNSIGIYLHWNGGPESVLAFLSAAKKLGVRDPLEDCYGIARITQIIANFFGGTTSIGIDSVENLDCDNGDNGVYYVGPVFTVVSRSIAGTACDFEQLSPGMMSQYNTTYAEVIKANKSVYK